MPKNVVARPAVGDHAEYYGKYMKLVEPGDLAAIMDAQIATLGGMLKPVTAAREGFAYAPGKWTIREVVGHLTDTERVFAFRAAAFSRGDAQPLPSFDQDVWTPAGQYNDRSLSDVFAEWTDARRATISLLRGTPEEALQRRGVASGNELTALAAITMLAGHVAYHVEHLRTQYGL